MTLSSEPEEPGAPLENVSTLVRLLDLEKIEETLYRGESGSVGRRRIFGGQVLAQALVASLRSVAEDRFIHSLHGYFILPGELGRAIVYEVENLRDGGSFSTRRVKAIQHGRVIFVMVASFHKEEAGLDHQAPMPDVPPPEALKSGPELFSGDMSVLPESMKLFWKRFQSIDFRPVDISRYADRAPREARQHIWFRAAAPLPDKREVHAGVLAYASDFALLETALAPHGKLLSDPDVRLASLDHALWFHRPFRADDWLLYSLDSPTSFGARGLCRGQIFNRDGRLVASSTQEGLMRAELPT